jgi:hypothetical protein
MDLWKQKPGLDSVLCRQVNVNSEGGMRLQAKFLAEAYRHWIREDEVRDIAISAIQESFREYMVKKKGAFRRLAITKGLHERLGRDVPCHDTDVMYMICRCCE